MPGTVKVMGHEPAWCPRCAANATSFIRGMDRQRDGRMIMTIRCTECDRIVARFAVEEKQEEPTCTT